MQQAKDLVTMVSTREKCREEALKAEKALFSMRSKVKEVKRKLAIVGGDEDLVPVKVFAFHNLHTFERWLTGDHRRRSLLQMHPQSMFAMPYGPTGPLLVRFP